jgi:hypothetical protein
MWVRRATQRAEPGAPQDFKGELWAGMLGACTDFALFNHIFALNARRAKREDPNIL